MTSPRSDRRLAPLSWPPPARARRSPAPPAAHAQDGAPDIQAPSAILVESSTGDVVFEREADEQRAIASTTKLMTALLALEGIALDDVLTVARLRRRGRSSRSSGCRRASG